MKPSFDFQRGDTVRIILEENNIFTEDPGLVLKVTDNEIEVRRDSDASIWTTDRDGKKSNCNGTQFIQLQKIYNPENNYKGQRVTAGIVEVTTKEFKHLHNDVVEILPVVRVKLYNDNNVEPPFYTEEFTPEWHGGVCGYIDFNGKFSI